MRSSRPSGCETSNRKSSRGSRRSCRQGRTSCARPPASSPWITRTRRHSRCWTRVHAPGPSRFSMQRASTRACCPRSPRQHASPATSRDNSPPPPGLRQKPPWSSAAATRWPPRLAREFMLREKSAMSSGRPSLFALCRLDHARTRPCWSNATRMRIQAAGCSKTRASCRAATYAGGEIKCVRSSATPRREVTAKRMTY